MPQSNFELRRKLLQLEALYDVGRALNTLRPEGDLLEELMQRAVAVLDAMIGFVFSLDEKLNVQHLYTFGIDLPTPSNTILSEPPVKQALASRQPISVSVPRFLGGPPSDLLIAPMIAGENVVGILGVGGKEERGEKRGSFVEDDLRFLSSLAAIGAAAIDNTRNYHRLDVIRESLEDENRNLKQRMLREYSDRLMVGDSPKMQRVIDLVARVADSQANVLIRGESGTGKEMVARLIHGSSARKDGPFVAINCAALPETLLESELFGIERGVATGVEARPGKFESAQGGTVFLDEIGDMPMALQAKLLRVLQEREIERVGGRRHIPIDVRVLAATNARLAEKIARGEFREDLYYRLRVVEIVLPPLRERREDIPRLARHILERFAAREAREVLTLDREAFASLLAHDYAGNVRELENLLEGAASLSRGGVIRLEDLQWLPARASGKLEPETPIETEVPNLRALQDRHIRRILKLAGGNKSRAARLLGISRRTLYRKKTSGH